MLHKPVSMQHIHLRILMKYAGRPTRCVAVGLHSNTVAVATLTILCVCNVHDYCICWQHNVGADD